MNVAFVLNSKHYFNAEMSSGQSKGAKKVKYEKGMKVPSGDKRPQSGKPTPKQTEKEKSLNDEIKRLKERIVMLECNLDPVQIMEKLKLSEETLINMLTEENAKLRLERSKYVHDVSETRPQSCKPTPKQTEKEKRLNDEIMRLKERIVMLECNLDPIKIMEKLKLSEETLINMLTEENAKLRLERSKYVSDDSETSAKLKKEIKKMTEMTTKKEKEPIRERPQSGKPTPKQTEKEKRLNDAEIKRLKERIVMLECNLDPVQIMEKLKLSEETLINMLTEENARLRLERSKYVHDVSETSNNEKKLRDEMKKIEICLMQRDTEIAKLRKEIQKMTEMTTVREKEPIRERSPIPQKSDLKQQSKVESGEEIQRKFQHFECKGLNGDTIMDDYPNISELSDVNRPTRLSEKFSELYDNEWTDAFEEAENEFKTEEKRIAYLYKTLLDVFDFCEQKSVEHENSIRTCVMTLPDSSNRVSKLPEIGDTNQRKLKEIRKSFAPMLVDSVFQSYLKEKKLNLSRMKNTENFVRKGVEICWLMNSQDPPVIIDSTVVTGKPFDADKYRTYTKTGKVVDYVVWPPMLLHKNGPVLCKGVAQGK